ncbi:MAG: hypothetical protein QN142_10855 [Armatimonadota bacterium]|nr:hypothetical protein [Armatimonadota bacterium]MDR7412299.1 hypothetical protein [Armatimonadota bacterium]MDR7425772.1 hypothetical protein [Armatimonadota bacterium]MDR7607402.1 hypothetical protein [Armatimonadota bacterium]MDR7609792.1 hypothetical protein [Armatimonadota bacterium]
MAFTVEDFSGLLRLLQEHPEWRAQLRAVLLGEELLSLPRLLRELGEEVRQLTEAHRRGEERLARLEEAQIRSEERLARLEEAQIRSEERLARLEEAQIRSEERLARLEEAVLELARAQRTMQEDFGRRLELLQRNQDRFAQVVGATAEARMVPTVKRWLESRGLVVLDPVLAWSLDGLTEFDGVTRAQGPQGVVWVLVSAKVRLQPGDVYDLANTLRRAEVRRRLEQEGVKAPVWPVVFGLTAERRVVQVAKELGVGLLLEGQGEVVAPRPLETLAP